jgi:TRAP-type transport system small permease protein
METDQKTTSSGFMDYLAQVVEFVMILLTVAMVVLVSYQVFERYVLHYTPPWSEELAVYLMIWFGIIGIAAGVRRETHMSLHYFADKLPLRVQRACDYIKYALILIYMSVLTNEGINMVQLTMPQKSAAMGLPVGFVYLALPVSTALILLFTVELLIKEIRKGRNR